MPVWTPLAAKVVRDPSDRGWLGSSVRAGTGRSRARVHDLDLHLRVRGLPHPHPAPAARRYRCRRTGIPEGEARMKRTVGYTWRLRELMATRGKFTATELVPLLHERDINLS